MKIIKFKNLSKFAPEVIHFISVKESDHNKNISEKGNLSLSNAEKKNDVIENRKLLAKEIGIPFESLVFAKQTHSNKITIVNKGDCGKGLFEYDSAVDDTDALITKQGNVCVVVLVADCVPVLLFDKRKKIIAAIHAGWKGLSQKIISKTIQRMNKEFGSIAADIIAGIGPSIGNCHFEVQYDVFGQFKEAFGKNNKALIRRDGKLFINLWEINKQQLLKEGVIKQNIEVVGNCTVCENDKFFSARKGDKGRVAVGVMLKSFAPNK